MEENKLVTLKLVGFNESERGNVHAVLTLADRALEKEWQLTDRETADFFLFAVGAATKAEGKEALKNLPLERCLFCVTKAEPQTERSILVDDKHLPRLSILVALFNQVTSHQAAIPATTEGEREPVASQDETFFDYQKGLLGRLLVSENEQLKVSLANVADFAPLYVDTEKKIYYSQLSLAQSDLYTVATNNFAVKICAKAEFENAVAIENLKARPLKDLFWYLAIKTSAGKVIKGHLDSDIVTLRGWPDLRLFKFLDYARIATFMKHNSAPLETIAEQTKSPLTVVNDFYNACYIVGLIEKREQLEITKRNITPELSDLLAKIDARLK
jgi:hypothetical protein